MEGLDVAALVEAALQHPDFEDPEARSPAELATLFVGNPALFLALFGRFLGLVQLRAIGSSSAGASEAVAVELERLHRVVTTGEDVSAARTANRRLRYFEEVLEAGDYMSEAEMRRRDPAGWEYYVRRGRDDVHVPLQDGDLGNGLAGFFIRALQKRDLRVAEAAQVHADKVVESVMTGEKPSFEPEPQAMDEGSDEDAQWMDVWRRSHKAAFVAGDDAHFDYALVDGREDLDDWRALAADAEEQWFDDDGDGEDGDGASYDGT